MYISNPSKRLLLHLANGSYEAVELAEVFFLAADGEDTLVRLRGSRPRRDVRPLADLERALPRAAFYRIHRSYLVHLPKVRFLRRRDIGRDWEIKLEPPVNRVLPVSRGALRGLVEALEG